MNRDVFRTAVLLIIVALIAASLIIRSHSPAHPASLVRRSGDAALYPPAETPGEVDQTITQENIEQTICVSGYTKHVRPPVELTNRIKRERMMRYTLSGTLSEYELDHIIPLELGGCPNCPTNLWMEPLQDAHEKDRVENYLHRQVCDGKMQLIDAQQLITRDWYAVFKQIEHAHP